MLGWVTRGFRSGAYSARHTVAAASVPYLCVAAEG